MAKTVVKCIIPNLDRRPDRWHVCRERLIERGIPPENIERCSSYDGRNYVNFEDARDKAAQHFEGCLPPFLLGVTAGKFGKFDFCWRWTWYTIVKTIATTEDNDIAYLMVIDDWEILIDYGELCADLEMLKTVHDTLHMVQLGLPPEPMDRVLVADNAKYQYGMAGRCDCAMIYTPQGARRLLDYANGLPKHPCSPSELIGWFSNQDLRAQMGCFAICASHSYPGRGAARGYRDVRVNIYEDRIEALNEVFVIVPNLDRRPDRWKVCREKLLNQGVPEANIERFSSYDHRSYGDLNSTKKYVVEQFGGTLPEWLNYCTSPSEYCWLWTWYTIIHKISLRKHGYYLLLVDDCEIRMSYDDICKTVQALCRATNHQTRIVQWNVSMFPVCRKVVKEIDILQYGLAGRSDMGMMFSPAGAKFLIEYANYKPADVPATLFNNLTYESDQMGFFAVSAKYHDPKGAVTHYRDSRVRDEQNRLETKHKSK